MEVCSISSSWPRCSSCWWAPSCSRSRRSSARGGSSRWRGGWRRAGGGDRRSCGPDGPSRLRDGAPPRTPGPALAFATGAATLGLLFEGAARRSEATRTMPTRRPGDRHGRTREGRPSWKCSLISSSWPRAHPAGGPPRALARGVRPLGAGRRAGAAGGAAGGGGPRATGRDGPSRSRRRRPSNSRHGPRPRRSWSLPRSSRSLPRPAGASFDWEWFIGRRALGWVSVVLILFAAAFFLRYAFENNWIGPIGRVALAASAGLALVAAGYRYDRRRGWRLFAQMLTAAGCRALLPGGLRRVRVLPPAPAAVGLGVPAPDRGRDDGPGGPVRRAWRWR